MSLRKRVAVRQVGLLSASSLIAVLALAPAQAVAQVLDRSEIEGSVINFNLSLATLPSSAGNDTVNVALGSALYQPYASNSTVPPDALTFNFGSGVNIINNNGFLMVGVEYGYVVESVIGTNYGKYYYTRDNSNFESFVQIQGLTTFNNSGDIYLGAFYSATMFDPFGPSYLVGTDRRGDDILSMAGADFIGGGGSRIFLDVNFNSVGQDTCEQALRNANGDLPVGDCIDLSGGSASGRTLVNIFNLAAADRGAYNPEGSVVVDVSGGDPNETSPDAFAVDPASRNYDSRTGGIDQGLFLYTLGYDSAEQQFRLYGIQSAASRQLPLLVHAAADLWRTSSGGWFERQTETRGEDGRGGGVWGRVVYSRADRGVTDLDRVGHKELTFDNSYDQEDTAVTFGSDLISADGAGGSWTAGAMIGYARSSIDFSDYANSAKLEGMHAGLYGAFTSGALFVDAAVNGTWLDLDSDVPALDLLPAGTLLNTSGQSLGARIEAGWRFGAGPFRLEPLVGLTHVRTTFEDMDVPADDPSRLGGEVSFEDATSTRLSAGVRFSIEDFVPLTPSTRLSVTARHGSELDGEAAASIVNVGPDAAPVANTFDGQFSELSAAFTAANAAETVAGYVNMGAVFGDDYDNLAASAGLRLQW